MTPTLLNVMVCATDLLKIPGAVGGAVGGAAGGAAGGGGAASGGGGGGGGASSGGDITAVIASVQGDPQSIMHSAPMRLIDVVLS